MVTATLHGAGDRATIHFERRLAHPIERVWRALTEPAELSHWFPAEVTVDLRVGGAVSFVFADSGDAAPPGRVTELDSPRLFAYEWGGDLLRWELRPDGDGCLLVFTYTFDRRDEAAKFAAGWDVCLAALDARLSGRPPADSSERWIDRYAAYREAFSEPTGQTGDRPVG
ncbi:MAG TPA: SRPBCC family protein [Micromonosporaceae bacterium]|jgi:uncharacterized protein YndB with AHSA1/START domain